MWVVQLKDDLLPVESLVEIVDALHKHLDIPRLLLLVLVILNGNFEFRGFLIIEIEVFLVLQILTSSDQG